MSKPDSDAPISLVAFYSLFRLNESNSGPNNASSNPHSSLGSAGYSAVAFSSQVDSSDGVDLELVFSDLPEEWNKQLKIKKHILGKFTRNTTYESGSILLLPTLVTKNKVFPPTKCYWSVLKDKDGKKYILCFINASESEGFNLFRYDLEKFSKRFEHEVLATSTLDTAESRQNAINFVSTWYHVAVDYIARTSLLLSDDLDVIIHSCLMGHKIEVKTTLPIHAPLVEDAIRLIESIQLPLPSTPSSSSSTYALNSEADALIREVVVLTFDHSGKPQVDSDETNEFCREWAARLIQAGSSRTVTDAILLRAWIEVVKMQLTQELNHIRKLCETAVIDNYALYEAFLYLKNNPNKDVLLVLLLKEGAADTNSKQVLHTIFTCLTTPTWTDHNEEDEDEHLRQQHQLTMSTHSDQELPAANSKSESAPSYPIDLLM